MWIKICGIKDADMARRAASAGASAIGLNFFTRSKRATDLEHAREISEAVRGQVELVGLFVNHALTEVVETARAVQLDRIQLHGDEPVSFLKQLQSELPTMQLIKAFRVGEDGMQELAACIDECQREEIRLSAILIDAAVVGEFGGTGHVAPWEIVAKEYDRGHWPPLILAGGLTVDNVHDAIEAVAPWGIDTASGVESSPGVKDPDMIAAFIEAANGQ